MPKHRLDWPCDELKAVFGFANESAASKGVDPSFAKRNFLALLDPYLTGLADSVAQRRILLGGYETHDHRIITLEEARYQLAKCRAERSRKHPLPDAAIENLYLMQTGRQPLTVDNRRLDPMSARLRAR